MERTNETSFFCFRTKSIPLNLLIVLIYVEQKDDNVEEISSSLLVHLFPSIKLSHNCVVKCIYFVTDSLSA